MFDIGDYIAFLIFIFLVVVYRQDGLKAQDDVFQLSGITTVDTTTEIVTNVHVYNMNRRNVTVSNHNGFFTMVVGERDTLRFTSIGYGTLFVPVSEAIDHSLIVSMQIDTTLLQDVVIYPLPAKNQLKWALMALDVPHAQDQLTRAQLSKAGFVRPPEHPEAPPPTLMNPISLFYEKVIKKIQKRKVKKDVARTAPKLE